MSNNERSDRCLRVAVSGSSGLIGGALCRHLASQGYEVVRLVRPGSQPAAEHPTEEAAPGPATNASAVQVAKPHTPSTLEWDPNQGLTEPDHWNQIDCVVHLAGHSIAAGRWTAAEKQRIRDSRVAATRRLVAQLLTVHHPPRVMISASAVGIYGDRGRDLVDERDPPASEFLANVASDWEEACQPLAQAGIRVAHPRFGIVLSPEGGALGKVLPLFRWYAAGRLGSGDQYWSWIALPDCIRGLQWLIETPDASGPYNLVAPQPVTNAHFTRAVAEAVGVKAPLPVPAWALRLGLGEMADALLLCSCRVMPRRLTQAGFTFDYPRLEEFLQSALRSPSTSH